MINCMYRSLENNFVRGLHSYDCHVDQYTLDFLFSLHLFLDCFLRFFTFKVDAFPLQ